MTTDDKRSRSPRGTRGGNRARKDPVPEEATEGTRASAFAAEDERARQAAEAIANDVGKGVKGSRIPDEKMLKVAGAAWEFCKLGAGVEVRPYQDELGLRLCQSLFMEDAVDLTALFARQSGKTETISIVCAGLLVLCPTLAKVIPDERVQKWSRGFWIGVFGPEYDTVEIVLTRLGERLFGESMRELMADPEIGIEPEGTKKLVLPNGSYVRGHSTNPRVQIEGHTYHFLVCDETQYIPDWRIRRSIHPMGAETAATIVKLGTPTPYKCEFYEACTRNKRHDMGQTKKHKRRHFEYDYTHAATYSRRYKSYVESEKERLGFESDEFRMAYRLHWLLERGQFVTPEVFEHIGIVKPSVLRAKDDREQEIQFTRSANVVPYDSRNDHVAGIDFGRSADSTIVTIGKPWWDFPVEVGDVQTYYTHVVNWLELIGDDHEKQYPQILSFLRNYKISRVMVDATGKGDPIYSRMKADLAPLGVEVIPFVFGSESKHNGFSRLLTEITAGRITYPAGAAVQRLAKYRRFRQQFFDLEKSWRGKFMVVEAPHGKKTAGGKALGDAHDDYPDSLMLMHMATQAAVQDDEVEMGTNPFFLQQLGNLAQQLAAQHAARGRSSSPRGILHPGGWKGPSR